MAHTAHRGTLAKPGVLSRARLPRVTRILFLLSHELERRDPAHWARLGDLSESYRRVMVSQQFPATNFVSLPDDDESHHFAREVGRWIKVFRTPPIWMLDAVIAACWFHYEGSDLFLRAPVSALEPATSTGRVATHVPEWSIEDDEAEYVAEAVRTFKATLLEHIADRKAAYAASDSEGLERIPAPRGRFTETEWRTARYLLGTPVDHLAATPLTKSKPEDPEYMEPQNLRRLMREYLQSILWRTDLDIDT